MQGLLGLSARLTPKKHTLLVQLGRTGVSDQAFLVALVIVQTMRFDRGSLFRAGTVGEVTGLPVATVRQAKDELLALGTLDMHSRQGVRRSVDLYSLSRAFLSRYPADDSMGKTPP